MSEKKISNKSVSIIVALTVLALVAFLVTLLTGLWGPLSKIPSYQEKSPQGHPVYYLSSAHFYDDNLLASTVEDEFIRVVNIGKNLTVKVDKYPGTVLVVKHWGSKIWEETDSAELIVRSEEQKIRWEEAIDKALKEYEESLKPRDVLPEES